MPAVRREHPYIWTTWLPRLLTGENSCEWATWFKAHYQDWSRPPSNFDLEQWRVRHTALLNEQRYQWLNRGYTVNVEDQNAFQLRGHSATLAGKPDLIVVNRNHEHIRVIDVKAGREQAWHRLQVMIYMYALPMALPQYRDSTIAGEVIYRHSNKRIPQGGLDRQFKKDLVALILRLADEIPPHRVPSPRECRHCDIAAADCPQRIDAPYEPEETATDDF